MGPAANWLLQLALFNGGTFTLTRLGSDQLRITGGGWSGTFYRLQNKRKTADGRKKTKGDRNRKAPSR
jgi:hypothetical protein